MLRSILVLALFAFSASVYADGFNYNAVTGTYGQIELDGVDVDGDSMGIDGSFEIGDKFFVFAGYNRADFSDGILSADIDTIDAGLGFHMPLSDRVDLVTQLSYLYVDISDDVTSIDDNGYGLGLGLRFAATDKIELNGGVSYVDYSDGGDDTSFGAAFLYNFTDNFTAGVSGDFSDDITAYGIGARFYFGN